MRRLVIAALFLLSATAQAQTTFNWLTFPVYGTITAGDCVKWQTSNASGVVPSVADAGAGCGTTANIANQTVLGNGSGSSAAPVALTLGGALVATATGLTTTQAINAQTGTTYTVLSSDAAKLLTFSNASAIAVTLPQAGTTGFTTGFSIDVQDLGAGTATVTPTTSTINGAASLTIPKNTGCTITSDGTNYQVSACTSVVPQITFLEAATTFTIAATGCTPSATSGGAFGGTITLATGPCTSIVITMNGATGFTAAHGYHCSVGDRTTQLAGTWIPEWNETASTTTTATIPIPSAAGATDVISFQCSPN